MWEKTDPPPPAHNISVTLPKLRGVPYGINAHFAILVLYLVFATYRTVLVLVQGYARLWLGQKMFSYENESILNTFSPSAIILSVSVHVSIV